MRGGVVGGGRGLSLADRGGSPAQTAGPPPPPPPRKIRFADGLRGGQPNAREVREAEDEASLGGLRDVAGVVERLPGNMRLGAVMLALMRNALRADGTSSRLSSPSSLENGWEVVIKD